MISLLFSNPIYFFISLLALVLAISVHEFAHGFAADRLGDPTPRLQGRLTLKPTAHLDKMGLLFLMLFGFGWGKPVEFDPYNLKNPRKDAAIISFAGPVSNFILAILCSILLRSIIFLNLGILKTIGIIFLPAFITYNVILGVFNLLPIHPLDGFKIVGGFLSRERAAEWYQLERYGMIFLILLIIPIGSSSMLDSIIRPVITFILNLLFPQSANGFI